MNIVLCRNVSNIVGVIRVLYVDDEAILLDVGKHFLEMEGEFSVDTARSAAAALQTLTEKPFDAIISDYQMPGMDGIGFLKTVSASGNTIPFILFTGRGREEVVIEALNEGADFYLQKGGEPKAMFAELRHKVRQVVEKRWAEQELHEREATLASIFRAAPTGIGMVVNRVIMKVNDRLCEMTGYTPGELLGKSARIFYPTDEDFEYVGREKYEQIRKSGTGTVETRWKKKDGSIRDILLSSTPLDLSNPAKGVTFTALDITGQKNAGLALRESERLLRDIIEKNPMSIQIVDRDGFTLRVNPAFTRLFGSVPPPDFSIISDLVKSHPEIEDLISQVKSGKPANLPDMSFNAHDICPELPDVPTRVRAIIFPLNDRHGKPQRFIFMHEDITEQMRAEDALRLANRKLNLLSGITRHDIRNQLLALTGYLEISKKTLGDPARTAEFIEKEKKVAGTIADHIRFTKDYEDLGVKEPVWNKVSELVRTVITGLPMRDIRIDGPDPSLEVFADPLFEKVFYNLIDNALRHGGGKVTAIRIHTRRSGKDLVMVVEDDGAGIGAEERERLFERGFGKNTGLGLFLSREILSITGMTITETGEPGAGARFEISVPAGEYRFVETG